MVTLELAETGSRTASRKPGGERWFKVVLPITATTAEDIVRNVLARLGLTANLIPAFVQNDPTYISRLTAQMNEGAAFKAALAEARSKRSPKISLTVRVGPAVVESIRAYLESLGRTMQEPTTQTKETTTGGGGATTDGVVGGTGTGTVTPVVSADVFERVYKQGQLMLTPLISALTTTLSRVGCGSSEARPTFEDAIRKLLARILQDDLAGVEVTGTGDKRKGLISQIAMGFGAPASLGSRLHGNASRIGPLNTAESCGGGAVRFPNNPMARVLDDDVHELHGYGVGLHNRLIALAAEIGMPYDSSRGVDQACGLLKQFPDVAQNIYAAAGLEGLASFPPQTVAALNADAETFNAAATSWNASAQRWEWIKLGGLVIAGIALTIITNGMAGPLAATLVGMGIGAGTGVLMVVDAENNLRFQMDAALFGGASQERVEFAEGEVQGAYAALVINVITMGALARFGGGATTPMLSRLVRITMISGAGGALTTAVQPNVWKSPDAGGMILWGTLVSAAIGGAGAGLGLGVARLMKPGAPVQIAISRGQGPLTKGKSVLVQLAPNEKPVNAVVTNIADDTITLQVQSSSLQVKVARAAKIQGNIFDPTLKKQATRIVDGIEVYDKSKHAKLAGVAERDLDAFTGLQNDYRVSKVPNTRGLFLAIPKDRSGRLAIIPGPTRDSNGAFKGWQNQSRPNVDMRGKGQTPTDEEIALFGAHGTPVGFTGISTRNAGRILADVIVTLNEMQVGAKGPVKAIELSSCLQGNRRFLFLGKTNAEAMQKHIDQRITELGYKGEHKIIVLAADRMGSLYGVDLVKVNGKFKQTVFVPAGTQRPLAYTSDVARASLPLVAVIVSSASLVGSVLVGVQALGGPDKAWQWIMKNRDRVLGWIFDETPAEPQPTR
jgi:hypothetical protein